MSYSVKEIYYTMQGEGVHTGRPGVFLRFTGCNLWDGVESHRADAVCRFCDTDFVGTGGERGGRYPTAEALAREVRAVWDRGARTGAGSHAAGPFVVCTGGEPALQLDASLVAALSSQGFYVAMETNGTIPPPSGVDWVCVSPKAGARLAVREGDELKLVFPQAGAPPEQYVDLDFDYFSLQPMDGPDLEFNTEAAVEYCFGHPTWRLSLQTHKLLGIR